jgi:hypothetical protein
MAFLNFAKNLHASTVLPLRDLGGVAYRERPFFMDWYLKEPRLFHCNYEGVDANRFPSARDDNYYKALQGSVGEDRSAEQE